MDIRHANLSMNTRLAAPKLAPLALLAAVALAGWLHPAALFATPTITYVQGNYTTPPTPQTMVSVTFTAAQAAGDLNVVVVGWNDSTAVVSTVTDESGDTYTRAVGPTVVSNFLSQSIYYAKSYRPGKGSPPGFSNYLDG
jgi:hypothetical protein